MVVRPTVTHLYSVPVFNNLKYSFLFSDLKMKNGNPSCLQQGPTVISLQHLSSKEHFPRRLGMFCNIRYVYKNIPVLCLQTKTHTKKIF